MIRPLLSLERLSLDERGGKVGYRYGQEASEVERMDYLQCGGTMKVISFLTDYTVVDRIIDHLKLTFVAERPLLNIFHNPFFCREEKSGRFSALFGLSAASRPPSTGFQFNLTAADVPIYHSPSRGREKWMLGYSFSRHSRKTNLLSFNAIMPGDLFG
jgi:hypothetical protein